MGQDIYGCNAPVRVPAQKPHALNDFEHKTATVRVEMDKANAASLTMATADAGFSSAVRR